MYSILFVPRFIEVDGSVLLNLDPTKSGKLESDFLACKEERKSSLSEIESDFNWVEVPYLFSDRDAEDVEDRLLAEKIVEAWRARLKDLYPDRTFIVDILEPELTGDVVGVGFFQRR